GAGTAAAAGTEACAGTATGAGSAAGAGTEADTGTARGAGTAADTGASAADSAVAVVGAGAGASTDVAATAAAPAPAGARDGFWARVFAARHRLAGSGRPLIKVCGITNRADAELAVALGADLLGFILAPSPRRARPEAIRALAGLPVLKVGVVVNDVAEALPLLRDGCLDALQLHGDEQPDECYEIAFPYYKALRPAPADLEAEPRYRCPRVLLDAYSPAARGGTGQRVAEDLLARRAAGGGARPLWLAGGIGPGNVAEVIRGHAPELIDASTGFEAEPGRKDHDKLRAFFRAVQAAGWRGAAGRRGAGAGARPSGSAGAAEAAGAALAGRAGQPPGPRGTAASADAVARALPDRLQPRHGVPPQDATGEATGDAEAAAPAPRASSTKRRTE
ncbi:MAG: phosphoribosylanthranilate isomerase, partial [Spirochaetaceae bacterium]|nr:phosphoribosylanthranilate isomerase [Spirochaetaceae bacterium]